MCWFTCILWILCILYNILYVILWAREILLSSNWVFYWISWNFLWIIWIFLFFRFFLCFGKKYLYYLNYLELVKRRSSKITWGSNTNIIIFCYFDSFPFDGDFIGIWIKKVLWASFNDVKYVYNIRNENGKIDRAVLNNSQNSCWCPTNGSFKNRI